MTKKQIKDVARYAAGSLLAQHDLDFSHLPLSEEDHDNIHREVRVIADKLLKGMIPATGTREALETIIGKPTATEGGNQ